MTMRQLSIAFSLLGLMLAATSVAATAQPVRNSGPCVEITAACQAAGFTPRGAASGNGLIADCIVPLMQGTNQPRQARNPLPQVDAKLIADCRASNPRFGQGNPPPVEAPAPSAPAQAAAAGEARPCASGDDVLPNGLVVVLPPKTQRDRSADLQALSNPFISGAAAQIDWRDIEPAPGKPDWARLDALFAAAENSKKWVQLLVFPGFFSPAWALEGVEADLFAIQYGPGSGETAKLPMPWDGVYLGRWFAFLKQLSNRYGNSPAFRLAAMDGPTSVSAEMSLPVKPEALQKWLSHGYTPRKYLDAWQKVFQVYAEDFPNQCLSLSAPSLPILEGGKVVDRPAHMRAREEIIEHAAGILGHRLAIQWSDLHAGMARVEAPDQTDMVIGYSGRIITGLQMRTSAHGDSAVMGAPGNPVLALRKSVDKGLRPNQAGRHINYLEIYAPDVLAADTQPVLRYAASLLARK